MRCCKFADGDCLSGVGPGEVCPEIVDNDLLINCENLCIFPDCRKLYFDGSGIKQVGNCGENCTFALQPDYFAIVHIELYMGEGGYYENGVRYDWSDFSGPLYSNGASMFEHCFDACFGPPKSPSPADPVTVTTTTYLHSNQSVPCPAAPTAAPLSCENQRTCCFFDCRILRYGDEGETIRQERNCGYNCTDNILPDVFGIVHPELYMNEWGYYENDEVYGLDDESGPLYNDGTCMWKRCLDSCFGTSPPTTTAPTSSPPTIVLPPGQFCFSGATRVTVDDGRGIVPMSDLKIGDKVLVDYDGNFETIYSFGHYHPKILAIFLQLNPLKIELSIDHMVYLHGQNYPVPASMVKIGDQVTVIDGKKVSKVIVTNIQRVVREGVYTPCTPSGTIVVNRLKSSNYVAFHNNSAFLILGSINIGTTQQRIAHTFLIPFRFWFISCCGKTVKLPKNGIASWIREPLKAANWFVQLHQLPITILFLQLLAVLCFLHLVSNVYYPGFVCFYLAIFFLSRRRQLRLQK
mmetsp:Transcript_5987/g.9475  ORF Transcript_5987/g.9475 Transcript_5987/m.9475 type:complete len:520 (-) Transcript_5987:32-1591(-)